MDVNLRIGADHISVYEKKRIRKQQWVCEALKKYYRVGRTFRVKEEPGHSYTIKEVEIVNVHSHRNIIVIRIEFSYMSGWLRYLKYTNPLIIGGYTDLAIRRGVEADIEGVAARYCKHKVYVEVAI